MAKKVKKVDKNELEQLQSIKINKQNLLIELGEIKLLEIQLAERLDRAKENKLRIENFELSLHNSINQKCRYQDRKYYLKFLGGLPSISLFINVIQLTILWMGLDK